MNLHALGWKAFEDLCASVCHVVLGQIIERFLPTHDGGRDAAFLGRWVPKQGDTREGRFVIQCKHSSRPSQKLVPSKITAELGKAADLAADGLCEHYILMTNMEVTGPSAAAIEGRLRQVPAVKSAIVLGSTWIEQQIRDQPRLRMQVPRLYGLGDLTQILDERRYRQATAILETYRHELSTFVMTAAFRSSVEALTESRFVILLAAR